MCVWKFGVHGDYVHGCVNVYTYICMSAYISICSYIHKGVCMLCVCMC